MLYSVSTNLIPKPKPGNVQFSHGHHAMGFLKKVCVSVSISLGPVRKIHPDTAKLSVFFELLKGPLGL